MHSLLVRFSLLLFALTVPIHSQSAEMNIIEEFQGHVAAKRWNAALPVIEEIVRRAPGISTSWRNYGVCLDELGRHSEAANAFAKAYELEPNDFGTQYRVFRSLSLANDSKGFIAFAESESKKAPEILDLISAAEEFKAIAQTNEFQGLLKRRAH